MIRTYLVAQGQPMAEIWTDDLTVEVALDLLRRHWNEEPEGSQFFVLVDDATGAFLASIYRPDYDPRIAIAAYPSGKVEIHKCEYILDDEGRYLRTEVTRLERW